MQLYFEGWGMVTLVTSIMKTEGVKPLWGTELGLDEPSCKIPIRLMTFGWVSSRQPNVKCCSFLKLEPQALASRQASPVNKVTHGCHRGLTM